jgi:hypothetical protein
MRQKPVDTHRQRARRPAPVSAACVVDPQAIACVAPLACDHETKRAQRTVVRRLPEVSIALWVMFLGITIWAHIRITHELPSLWIRRPADWHRPTAYRLDEIVSSHYLLFEPERDPAARASALANGHIDSVESERPLFVAWATSLTPADGVDIMLDVPSARIVRIRDKIALGKSRLRMVSGRQWRPVFLEANERALARLGRTEPSFGFAGGYQVALEVVAHKPAGNAHWRRTARAYVGVGRGWDG